MVYFTSDLHFFHDREFIYKPRGFSSEEQMRNAYTSIWKDTVTDTDDVYVCGDFCLGQDYTAIENLIHNLPGKIHLIIGNHDTSAKIDFYNKFENIVEITYATILKYKKRSYYVSHYVTQTSSLETDPKHCLINVHGHVHENKMFTNDIPYLINVSVDVTGGKLLTFEDINNAFKSEVLNCIKYL